MLRAELPENGRCLEVFGKVGFGHFLEQAKGIGLVAIGGPPIGASQTGLGNSLLDGCVSVVQGPSEHTGGLGRADSSHGPCGGRGNRRIMVAQETVEKLDGPGVPPLADGIDDAHTLQSLEFPDGAPQGLVDRRTGNRLQGGPGVGVEFFVGQEGDQCRHGVRRADAGQLLTGLGLVER